VSGCKRERWSVISRISRFRHATSEPSTLPIQNMVYSYSPPFQSGKLKVSDTHSLQSVSSSRPHLCFVCFFGLCLTWKDSYEVSGNRDGAPGAFHDSPGYPASNSGLSPTPIMLMNVDEQPSSFMVRFVPNNAALLNVYMEVVPAADATRRIAVSLIPINTRSVQRLVCSYQGQLSDNGSRTAL
jgi:hypothetical protein